MRLWRDNSRASARASEEICKQPSPRSCWIPEARRGDLPATAVATDGHLREPILYAANIARAFGATSDGAALSNFASSVSEPPFRSPSVFNFFAPDYAIPGTSPTLFGPEFNLQTTATSLLRINFAYQFAFTTIAGTTVDFTSTETWHAIPLDRVPCWIL